MMDETMFELVHDTGRGAVLVIAPHPDDEVFGCAGAIRRHVLAGDPVMVAIVTDGADGVEASARAAYATERETESERAAALLGYGQPEFWRWPDGGLRFGEDLIARILTAIEGSAAAWVYLPSPDETHSDHRVLAAAGTEAVRRCERELQLVFYEVSCPLQPTVLLDISDLLETKRGAIRCFASQLRQHDYEEHILALSRVRTYGLPSTVTAAEAFHVASRAAVRAWTRSTGLGYGGVRSFPAPSTAPLVSVVVRTLGRSTLRTAINSVTAQTHDNIELVVVDAAGKGLPDVTSALVSVKHCGDDHPLSRSEAANVGLAAATGEFILFLDDDDWLYPDHVAALLAALADDRLGGAAYAGVECLEVDGVDTRRVRVFNERFDPVRLLYENFIPVHAMLFRRSLVDEGCRFDTTLSLYEDWDFWLQIASRTRIRHIDRISAAYRMPGASSLHDGDDGESERAYQAVLAKWQANRRPELVSALLRAIHTGKLPAMGALRVEAARLGQALAEAERIAVASQTAVAVSEREALDARTVSRELSMQLEARNVEVSRLQGLVAAHTARLSELRDELDSRTAEVFDLHTQLEARAHELAELRVKLTTMAFDWERCRADREAKVQNENALRVQLAANESYVNALLDSKSWRWMAPLRIAVKLVRGR